MNQFMNPGLMASIPRQPLEDPSKQATNNDRANRFRGIIDRRLLEMYPFSDKRHVVTEPAIM